MPGVLLLQQDYRIQYSSRRSRSQSCFSSWNRSHGFSIPTREAGVSAVPSPSVEGVLGSVFQWKKLESLLRLLHVPEESFKLGHDSLCPPHCESCSTGNEFQTFFPKLPLCASIPPPNLHPLLGKEGNSTGGSWDL
ncbi:hypothetical protein CHARACLAT_032834 [Characodon lateralis]|uniref:Uncharacterized protein n=1 Tax=Characodon lateralis TaxID=208331 RepID=A0ABU7F8A1_9TELE|nr:hypothetical protein [Characodon lateralis]